MISRRICVIGCTKRGVQATIMLSSCGRKVTLVDENRGIISEVARGNLPFYDPEAATEISKGMLRKRISLSNSVEKAARNSEIIFVSSVIPTSKYGSANLSRLLRDVKKARAFLRKNSTVVMLSKVPPGTTEGIVSETIEKSTSLRCSPRFRFTGLQVRPGKDRDWCVSKEGRGILGFALCGKHPGPNYRSYESSRGA